MHVTSANALGVFSLHRFKVTQLLLRSSPPKNRVHLSDEGHFAPWAPETRERPADSVADLCCCSQQ